MRNPTTKPTKKRKSDFFGDHLWLCVCCCSDRIVSLFVCRRIHKMIHKWDSSYVHTHIYVDVEESEIKWIFSYFAFFSFLFLILLMCVWRAQPSPVFNYSMNLFFFSLLLQFNIIFFSFALLSCVQVFLLLSSSPSLFLSVSFVLLELWFVWFVDTMI